MMLALIGWKRSFCFGDCRIPFAAQIAHLLPTLVIAPLALMSACLVVKRKAATFALLQWIVCQTACFQRACCVATCVSQRGPGNARLPLLRGGPNRPPELVRPLSLELLHRGDEHLAQAFRRQLRKRLQFSLPCRVLVAVVLPSGVTSLRYALVRQFCVRRYHRPKKS
jgi:hypothetical protein